MKRTEMITRLATVGYSATELSHMSSMLLHATYEQAKPLLDSRRAELEKVIGRDSKRQQKRKSWFASRQNEEVKEAHWLDTWRPPTPIAAHVPQPTEKEVDQAKLREMIAKMDSKLRELGEKFRDSGDHSLAREAQQVTTAKLGLESMLKEIAQ